MLKSIKAKYIKDYRDASGKRRVYYRRGSAPEIRLPDPDENEEGFWEAYAAAGRNYVAFLDMRQPSPGDAPSPGSLASVIAAHLASSDFKSNQPGYRKQCESLYEKAVLAFGRGMVDDLSQSEADEVRGALGRTADTINAAGYYLSAACRTGMKTPIGAGSAKRLCKHNPFRGLGKRKPSNPDGYHTWTTEEIETFRATWDYGTKERLAFELYLCTAGRGCDVFRLTRDNLQGNKLTFTPKKTRGSSGVTVVLRVHRMLQPAIDLIDPQQLFLIHSARDKPFAESSGQQWFSRVSRATKLPSGRTGHGLRKASGARLAEAGATAHEIMAHHGLKSLAVAEIYTRRASRQKLARSAVEKIEAFEAAGKFWDDE